MEPIVLVIHVLACIAIIALVLLQQGKGADMGAAFGSGASSTVFGSPGSATFMLKLTAGVVAVFFATCLSMGYLTVKRVRVEKVRENAMMHLPVDDHTSGKTTSQTDHISIPLPSQEDTD